MRRQRASSSQKYLRRQAQNFPPPSRPQLSTDRPSNPRSKHLLLVIKEHTRVVIELDYPPIRSRPRLLRAYDESSPDVPLLHFHSCGRKECGCWDGPCAFYDADYLVADTAPAVVDFVLEDVHALNDKRTRVVYDLERKVSILYQNEV